GVAPAELPRLRAGEIALVLQRTEEGLVAIAGDAESASAVSVPWRDEGSVREALVRLAPRISRAERVRVVSSRELSAIDVGALVWRGDDALVRTHEVVDAVEVAMPRASRGSHGA